mgnify:CR=1 FL=1
MTTNAARARQIVRETDGVRRHLDAMALVRDLARGEDLDTRRRAEVLAAVDRAEAEVAALARDAERREDDETLRCLHRLGAELAVVGRMISHAPALRVVRDDGGAVSGR